MALANSFKSFFSDDAPASTPAPAAAPEAKSDPAPQNPALFSAPPKRLPKVDLLCDGQVMRLDIEAPGIILENVDIQVEEKRVNITLTPTSLGDYSKHLIIHERCDITINRSIDLPLPILTDEENIKCERMNGVISVVAKVKQAEAGSKKLMITDK